MAAYTMYIEILVVPNSLTQTVFYESIFWSLSIDGKEGSNGISRTRTSVASFSIWGRELAKIRKEALGDWMEIQEQANIGSALKI